MNDIDLALFSSGMSPILLQLEVTESMVMRNVARAVRVLDAIQSRGIRLAIDDFGTGYSSMSLMKQFPIDTIKIDRSFVRDLPQDTEDCAIAEAIIGMGKALGMTIVAEDIETEDQQTFLRDHACDEMQGYLFSKPVPAQQMAELLRSAPEASLAAVAARGRLRCGCGSSKRSWRRRLLTFISLQAQASMWLGLRRMISSTASSSLAPSQCTCLP